MNPKKCEFAKRSVKFIGYVIDKNSFRIPDDRVKVIEHYPMPKNKKDLGRFLGVYASVHQFLPQASGILSKLNRLRSLKTARQFQEAWDESCGEAFDKAKKHIGKAVLLAHPDRDAETEIWCDASQGSVGAVLMQKQGGHWVPLSFWSKALNKAQVSYSVFDKEMLAISYSVRHFRDYLEGQSITVRTDHRPLVGALSKRTDSQTPIQRRHLNYISQYVDKLEYLEGERNTVADALSRLPADCYNIIGELGDDTFVDNDMVEIKMSTAHQSTNMIASLTCATVYYKMPTPVEFKI